MTEASRDYPAFLARLRTYERIEPFPQNRRPDKLAGVAHHPAPVTGSPILDEATGWLDCRVRSEQPAGDHVLVIAEVVEAGLQHAGKTLTLEETGFRYAG